MTDLAFGITVWEWSILIIAYIITTACVENEKGFWAFVTLLIATVIVVFPTDEHAFRLLHFALVHPGKIALFIVGYFLIGTLWGVIKWFLYVTHQFEIYNEVKQHFLRYHGGGGSELTPALALEFRNANYNLIAIPQVRDHKRNIYLWVTYWPFSSLWTFINDPIRRLFHFIYKRIQGALQAISDRLFRDIKIDLELAIEEELRLTSHLHEQRLARLKNAVKPEAERY